MIVVTITTNCGLSRQASVVCVMPISTLQTRLFTASCMRSPWLTAFASGSCRMVPVASKVPCLQVRQPHMQICLPVHTDMQCQDPSHVVHVAWQPSCKVCIVETQTYVVWSLHDKSVHCQRSHLSAHEYTKSTMKQTISKHNNNDVDSVTTMLAMIRNKSSQQQCKNSHHDNNSTSIISSNLTGSYPGC